MILRLAPFAALAALLCAQSADLKPGAKYTAVQRLDPERLAAVHAAREKFASQRKALPPRGVYQDYRAVIHIHAEDAAHTLGKRPEVLAAAKETGTRVVVWSDHGGPRPDSWHGLRDGVLFIPGGEYGDTHLLAFPAAEPRLRFHSHVEGDLAATPDGFDGMEIYNRHADAEDDADVIAYIRGASLAPGLLQTLAGLVQKYPDEVFGAGCDYWPQIFTRWDEILTKRPFPGLAANDSHQNTVIGKPPAALTLDPYAVAFRNVATHILAREFTEPAVLDALRRGRAYVSHDWLCDPAGFHFGAVNTLGVYEVGDSIPIAGTTRISVRTPVPAIIKVFHNGKVILEQKGSQVFVNAPGPGAYRAEAWLEIDGEMRPWIYSNALRAETPSLGALALPSQSLAPGVEAVNDTVYTQGPSGDAQKHQLDIYRVAGAKNAPVLFFVHGGAWVRGDRKQYPFLGSRFAQAGYVVVVPSYRLAPKDPHPAQIEDVAAAFAWTVSNIAAHGGDPKRIFLAGHSAGGHLVSLLATNPSWLAKYSLTPASIRGVMSLSGVPDVTAVNVFPNDAELRRAASPIFHVRSGLPPFLITYCQWDYDTLPAQAVAFDKALREAGTKAQLAFIPGENHISEIASVAKPADPTAVAILQFMQGLQ